MFGLAYIVFFAIYLGISILVVRGTVKFARRHEKNVFLWGTVAAFIMYNLVFWDWIPTVATHQYYCASESGFWVYKPFDQWKAENPGVMQGLVANERAPYRTERFDDGHVETHTYFLNDRFNWIVTQQDISRFLPIIRTEQQVKDVKNGEVLARYVNFSAGSSVKNTVGPPGPLKFWLSSSNCNGGSGNRSLFWQFTEKFNGKEK